MTIEPDGRLRTEAVRSAAPSAPGAPGHRRSGRHRLAALEGAVTGRFRLLPSFLVVGTKRGGSSSMTEALARHPQVRRCLVKKGTHYFDVNYGLGWSWYRSRFPLAPPGRADAVTGEGSPYYMYHPLAPERIAAALSSIRLVCVLRDPVARAWSEWNYERLRGLEDLGFEEALDAEPGRLAGEVERMRAEPGYESPAVRHHSYLARGRYAEQLQTLFALFGRDRVVVVRSEDFFARPADELARVQSFLGIAEHAPAEIPHLKAREYGPLPTASRARLEEYYAGPNADLQELVGVSWPTAATT